MGAPPRMWTSGVRMRTTTDGGSMCWTSPARSLNRFRQWNFRATPRSHTTLGSVSSPRRMARTCSSTPTWLAWTARPLLWSKTRQAPPMQCGTLRRFTKACQPFVNVLAWDAEGKGFYADYSFFNSDKTDLVDVHIHSDLHGRVIASAESSALATRVEHEFYGTLCHGRNSVLSDILIRYHGAGAGRRLRHRWHGRSVEQRACCSQLLAEGSYRGRWQALGCLAKYGQGHCQQVQSGCRFQVTHCRLSTCAHIITAKCSSTLI